MAILSGNPYLTSTKLGSFSAYTDGVFQGLADSDPAVQNWLNMGFLSMAASSPMWGGLPISEQVFAGTQSNMKPTLTPSTSVAGITGFSVFDNGHHGVITPGPSNVPLFYPGMDLPFYRMGSGARVPLRASTALLSLVGGTVLPSVTWNFSTGELEPTAVGPTVAVTSIVVTGSANPYTGTVTTAAPHGFQAGDTITQAGFTPSGYNNTFEVLSVPSTTTYTIALTTNPGAITTEGTTQIAAGTGTLSIEVLSLHTNSRIVFNDPSSGNIRWETGLAAIVKL